ncbi:MAG: STAS domain-containing protein [Burkholderiales bacterium]|nr:STAS domain-containing protein [Burkholderiales bacterium]
MVLNEQELNLRNAVTAQQAGLHAIAAGADSIDLAALTSVDSSAVAVLLSWVRAAQAANRPLTFTGAPANLLSLVSLYGFDDILSFAVSPSPERH